MYFIRNVHQQKNFLTIISITICETDFCFKKNILILCIEVLPFYILLCLLLRHWLQRNLILEIVKVHIEIILIITLGGEHLNEDWITWIRG